MDFLLYARCVRFHFLARDLGRLKPTVEEILCVRCTPQQRPAWVPSLLLAGAFFLEAHARNRRLVRCPLQI